MVFEFQCSRCRWVKTEPDPLRISDDHFLCRACVVREQAPPTTEWRGRPVGWQPPPAPPPMRGGSIPHAPGVSVTLVVLVFLMGVVVGTKMAGGW